jgi:hypothetical protein
VLDEAASLLVAPLYALSGFALAAAVVAFHRRRAQGAVLAIGALAVGWTGLIMLMTELGFSGNPRYLMLGAALACVLAGVGAARLFEAGARAAMQRGRRATNGAALVVAVIAAALVVAWPARQLAGGARSVRSEAAANEQLQRLVVHLGGPAAVLPCGRPTAGRFQRPILAWLLGVHARDVAFTLDPGAPGFVFRRHTQGVADPVLPRTEPPYRLVAALGRSDALVAACTRHPA